MTMLAGTRLRFRPGPVSVAALCLAFAVISFLALPTAAGAQETSFTYQGEVLVEADGLVHVGRQPVVDEGERRRTVGERTCRGAAIMRTRCLRAPTEDSEDLCSPFVRR